ncbi:hypothetical protein [Luethyella okanaganae]|uniref:Secreted protein n=1 Tax=Luethyella okanaganae TaxID=69372 RepID=A0ABW1VIW0_9MICO
MSEALWWLPSLLVFGVAFAGAVAGIVALRRSGARRGEAADAALLELQRQAGSMLVRADNRVQESEDELAFALAQFGEAEVVDYRAAIGTARRRLREAFLVQQRLDDDEPDTREQRRRRNEQIVELCESVESALVHQDAQFRARRAVERAAPDELEAIRALLRPTDSRSEKSRAAVVRFQERYAPSALVPLEAALDQATSLIVSASGHLDASSARIADGTAQPVADTLRSARDDTIRAGKALDALERAAGELTAAEVALAGATVQLRDGIVSARAVRDTHDDASEAARLNAAIDDANALLAAHAHAPAGRLPDPLAELDGLRDAIARLDTATAGARGQQDRLEHARQALAGALVSARSHIVVARDYVAARRSAVGAAARTRLAEAERQLMLAEAESDPVAALDTARRAIVHANDADALARYDVEVRGS